MWQPVVKRFFCPPEIPLIISSPTMVSAQMSSPKILARSKLAIQKSWHSKIIKKLQEKIMLTTII
jgi:hypothetical protein